MLPPTLPAGILYTLITTTTAAAFSPFIHIKLPPIIDMPDPTLETTTHNDDQHQTVSTFKAPTFTPHDPALWFTILEISFRASRITSSLKKMSHALTLLPHDVLSNLSDVVESASNSDTPYEDLKKALTTRLQSSLTARLQELLSTEQLGNEKPTDLLRRMKKLVGNTNHIDVKLLTHLFYQRLPPSIQRNMFTVKEKLPLDDLAQLADEFMDTIPTEPTVNNITSPSNDIQELKNLTTALIHQVSELSVSIANIKKNSARSVSPAHRRSRSRYNHSANSNNHNANSNGQCFYHNKFGSEAYNCQKPCTYSGNGSSSH